MTGRGAVELVLGFLKPGLLGLAFALVVASALGLPLEARADTPAMPAYEAEAYEEEGLSADGESEDFSETAAFDLMQVDCWSCKFVSVFMYAGDAFARESFSVIGSALIGGLGATAGSPSLGGAYGLLTWFFMIWITLQATKLFFPDMTEGPGQVLKAVAIRSLLFVIIVGVLSSGSAFFSYGPHLALSTGGGAAAALSDRFDGFVSEDEILDQTAGDCGGSYKFGDRADLDSFGYGIDTLENHMSSTSGAEEGIKGVFCLIHRMQAMSAVGLTMSFHMVSQTLDTAGGSASWWNVFDKIFTTLADLFFILIGALIMAIIFGIGLIAAPFYFIDVLIRIFLVAAFGPFLLAGAMFRPTRGMFWTGVKLVFGAMMNIIGLALVYGLSTTMMRLAPSFVEKSGGGTFGSTQELMQGMRYSEVAGVFGLSSTGYWMFLMGGVLLLLLLKKISSLVSGVFGDNTNFGTNMGTSAARLAKTGAMGVTMIGGLAAGKAVGAGAAAAAPAVSSAASGAASGAKSGAAGLMSRFGGRNMGNLEE